MFKKWSKWPKLKRTWPEHTYFLVAHCKLMGLTMTLMVSALCLVGVTTGRCGQGGNTSGQHQDRDRDWQISELNTNAALVAVSSGPDQIGILAVTIKIISNFKCANKNIYCLQWPSRYWALGPLPLHNLTQELFKMIFHLSCLIWQYCKMTPCRILLKYEQCEGFRNFYSLKNINLW